MPVILKERKGNRAIFVYVSEEELQKKSNQASTPSSVPSTFPIPEHETWFVFDSSKIMDYMACPRKFFFRYILGWEREEPNIHLIFGSAWHEAKEAILQLGYSREAEEEAYKRFLAYYRTYYPEYMDLDNAPKNPANAKKAITEYIAEYASQDTFQNLYTEIGVAVPINEEGDEIYGKLDSININKEGKYFSLEHKTSSQQPAWWYDQWLQRFQIGTYYHILCAQYGYENVLGIVVDGTIFRKKGNAHLRSTIVKSLDQMEDWLAQANFWVKSIKKDLEIFRTSTKDSKVLPCFQKNTNSCISYNKLCPFFHVCSAWANPLKSTDEIPIGYRTRYWDPRKADDTGKEFKHVLDLYTKTISKKEETK